MKPDKPTDVARMFRLNSILHLICECSRALARAEDETGLLEAVCRIAVEHGGYRFAWVGLEEKDEPGTIRQAAQAGFKDGCPEVLNIPPAAIGSGHDPAVEAIRTGRNVVTRHISNEPASDRWSEVAIRHACSSAIALPIVSDGHAFGVLVLLAEEPGAFDSTEAALLEQLSADMAHAIAALRRNAGRAQSEEEARNAYQRLMNIIEFLPDATFVIDQDKRVVAWNRACETMTGAKKETVLGRGDYIYSEQFFGERRPILIDLLDHPSPEVEEIYKYLKRTGDMLTGESFIPRLRGGQGAHLWGVAAPLFDQEGLRCGAIESIRDVTEQKQVEQALRESELKHRTLFETADDAILLMRHDRFIDCNARTLTMYGCSRDQIVGEPPYKYSPPTQPDGRDSKEKALELIGLALSEGPQFFEWEHCRLDGTSFMAEVSLNRLELGRETLLQAIVRDITERKHAKEALRHSEATINSVFRAAPVGICILKNRVYESANKFWCEKFGYPEESIIGKTTRMLYDSDEEWNRVGLELYADLQERGVASVETRLRCSDGSFRDVFLTAAPIRQEDLSAGTVVIIHDITERKRAEAERERLMAAIEQSGEIIFITDPEGVIQYVNPAFVSVTGYGRDEVIGKSPRILKSGLQDEEFYRELWRTITSGKTWKGRLVNKCRDGTLVTEDTTISPVRDAAGNIVNFVAIKRDITEHLRSQEEKATLEDHLRQAQKVEAIGRLAGGLAHDFNNMLSIILSYGESVLDKLNIGDPLRDEVKEILKAGRRSAELTRQILAFSRRQTLQPEVLDLNALVTNLQNMLHRLIGEDIEVILLLSEDLGRVLADPAQIEQVIVNLALNARDAMAQGGKLILKTANAELDDEYCKHHMGATPGSYVTMTVTDTGCGMDRQTVSQIFEPFFTTKEKGKGTGLGLSTVYGIIKQSGGNLWARSEPGQGTTISIYLPRTMAEPEKKEDFSGREDLRGGREHILVIEDEEALRDLVEKMLSSLGYQVSVAPDGETALMMVEEKGLRADLILTDVIMTGMSGSELIERLRITRPDLKVIYMSGYTDIAMDQHELLDSGALFLQKPFNLRNLSVKVRESLRRKTIKKTRKSILMIDDEEQFRDLMMCFCTDGGHEFTGTDSSAGAIEILARQPVDVLLLDMNIPGTDGMRILEEIRSAGHATPVIVLSGDLGSVNMDSFRSLGAVWALEKSADPIPLLNLIAEL